MTLWVNGSEFSSGSSTLAELLRERGVDPRSVAIEFNGEVLPRTRYSETTLGEGDRIEIVGFVQGG